MTKQKVLEIRDAKLSILNSTPPTLAIKAFGAVGRSGWKDAELVPYIYIQPPPDGIYDFDFVAEPSKFGAAVVTPIEVTYQLKPLPDGLRGVRIHVNENSNEPSKEFLL